MGNFGKIEIFFENNFVLINSLKVAFIDIFPMDEENNIH